MTKKMSTAAFVLNDTLAFSPHCQTKTIQRQLHI